MSEAEWLACTDPMPMLHFLRGRVSDRKLRLFAVACCRLLLRTVQVHPWHAHGIAVAERFADGEATTEELQRSAGYPPPDWFLEHAPGCGPIWTAPPDQPPRKTKLAVNACWNAMEVEDAVVLADCASTNAAWAATQPGSVMPDDNGVSARRLAAYQTVQSGLLRDVIGNPFRPVVCDNRWRTSTAITLAESIYADRAFDRLPILADALEDAGCDNADILAHLRGEGPHVRGCWALDLVLGKQ